MKKHRILQAGRLLPSLEKRLAAEFDLHLLANEADPQAFLREHGAEFVGYVASAALGISAATMDALPNLRVISSFGVGLDKLDLAITKIMAYDAAREALQSVKFHGETVNRTETAADALKIKRDMEQAQRAANRLHDETMRRVNAK